MGFSENFKSILIASMVEVYTMHQNGSYAHGHRFRVRLRVRFRVRVRVKVSF